MTIICALHEPGVGTWIGSDSMACAGDVKAPAHVRKWVFAGAWAIGQSGHPRALSLAEKNAEKLAAISCPFDLATTLRDMLRDDGFVVEPGGGAPSDYGQRWLLARADGLWDSDGGGNVVRVNAGSLWARGSGRDFALGAAFAAPDTMSALHVVAGAIQAACYYDSGCGGEPFVHLLKAA